MRKLLALAFLVLLPTAGWAQQLCPVGQYNFNGQCLNNTAGAATISGQTGTGSAGKGGSLVFQGGLPSSASTATGDVILFQDPGNLAVKFSCSQPTTGSAATATCTFNNIAVSGAGAPATIANNTILGNVSGAPAAATALPPVAVSNIQSAVISVAAASTSNIPSLSGTGVVVDGITPTLGQSVLIAGQTSSINDGIYIVQSGAWTLSPNAFPSGYVISPNCQFAVMVTGGVTLKNHTLVLATTSAVTVGTSAQTWTDSLLSIPTAGPATRGMTWTTLAATVGAPAASVQSSPGVNNCASFFDTNGSIYNLGNTGSVCAYGDSNFNIAASENAPAPGSVTGTGCSLGAGNNTNNSGRIVATGADTCTLNFGGTGGFTHAAPICVVSGESATVLPFVSTTATATAVIIKTAAAGTLDYVCL